MLRARVTTSFFLVAFFLVALIFAPSWLWSLICLAATLIGVWEWCNLINLNKIQMRWTVASASIIGLLLIFITDTQFAHLHDSLILGILSAAAIFWVFVAPLWLITRIKINRSFIMTILGLVLLLSLWIGLIGLQQISPWLLLSILATVWIADIAAYFSGKRFGKHKLAIEISPGKTWEGVAGALVAVTFYGLLLCHFKHYQLWVIIGLWAIVVLSIIGDLFESLLKRQAGIKDSSQLLPGHGGVLDRIDGLIPSLPLVLFFIYLPLFSNIQLHV
ncbi:MAG: phosphatidate cytidylyltransferase [Methylotenera sp.]|nr:phosphatidate cytidylyltransferase [Methylotenera sp.]